MKKTYQAYSTTICNFPLPNSKPILIMERYAYQIETNRFFELKLRSPRPTKRKPILTKQKSDRTEDELKANLNSLTLVSLDDDDNPMPDTPDTEEDETSFKIDDIPLALDLPQRRFNAALAVGMDDKLYIYGGTYEIPGRGEMTLDDFHVIDLGRLDGVRTLFNKTILPLDELVSSSDDDDDDTDTDDDGNASEDKEEMDDIQPSHPVPKHPETKMDLDIPAETHDSTTRSAAPAADDDSTETTTKSSFNPSLPQPLPFETLKAYYDRTGKDWLALLVSERSKAARREAFVKAEGYWWECREEVREEEERMEESGVKEVVVGTVERKEKRR